MQCFTAMDPQAQYAAQMAAMAQQMNMAPHGYGTSGHASAAPHLAFQAQGFATSVPPPSYQAHGPPPAYMQQTGSALAAPPAPPAYMPQTGVSHAAPPAPPGYMQQTGVSPAAPPAAPLAYGATAVSPPAPPVALPPCDSEQHTTVDKTAAYVARNGQRFEDMVRQREGANPKFSFLNEHGEGAAYFKWRVYCFQRGVAAETQDAILREAFPTPDTEQQKHFFGMLDVLSGSKDHIRNLRAWIVAQEDAEAGRIHWICEQLRHRVHTLTGFTARLHIIYVVNDVLHAGLKRRAESAPGATAAAIDGICSRMSKHMVRLLQPTYQEEPSTTERAKVHKVIGLWRDRGIFDAQDINSMEAAVMNGVPIPQPVTVDMHHLSSWQAAQQHLPPPEPPGDPPADPVQPPAYGTPQEPPPQYGAKPPLPPGVPPPSAMAFSSMPAMPGVPVPMATTRSGIWTSPEEIPPGLLVFVSNLMRSGGSPGYTPIPLHICPTQPPPPQPPNPTLTAGIEEFYAEPAVARIQRQAESKRREIDEKERLKKEEEERLLQAEERKKRERQEGGGEAKAQKDSGDAPSVRAAAVSGACRLLCVRLCLSCFLVCPSLAGLCVFVYDSLLRRDREPASRSLVDVAVAARLTDKVLLGVSYCTPRKTIPKISNQMVGIKKAKAAEVDDDDDVADVFKL